MQREIYLLSDKKVEGVHNLPMIEIKFLTTDIDITLYDAFIFTSKNGVKAIDNLTPKWKEIPSYAIAPATAKVIQSYGGKLVYTGSAHHGDQFAEELISLLKGEKVLYIGGEKTVSSLVDILNSKGITCDKLALYETVCKKYDSKIVLPKNAIIIFSSPSTIECFFESVVWDESFQAISIGQTTAKYFPQNIKPIIAKETSLESCIQEALAIS